MAVHTSLAERIEIMQRSARGEPVWRIARSLGWRASTIRKWRRRAQLAGRSGLGSAMGRPARGALSSFAAALAAHIRQLREAHPGWGPQTLRAELAQETAGTAAALPSAATIGRFLKEQGLTQPPAKHSQLPQSQPQPAGMAHAVWELDARGYSAVPEVGVVTLINLNDRASHLRLLSYPCRLGAQRASRHASTEDYQAALRLAFRTWGLPAALQVDHDSVFYDNTSQSPFPTRLHLWLLALGVTLTFGRPHQPQDQAMTERSHQLWAAQVLQGGSFVDWAHLYRTLEQRRDFLNYHLPCRSLAHQPPLVAFPDAVHSGRWYELAYEAELLELARVYAYLAQGRWFRLVAANGTLRLGQQVYYAGLAWRRHQLEITFDADTLHLRFANEAGEIVHQVPIRGLSRPDLMGDWQAFATLPALQLGLPFSWDDQRLIRLYEIAS